MSFRDLLMVSLGILVHAHGIRDNIYDIYKLSSNHIWRIWHSDITEMIIIILLHSE